MRYRLDEDRTPLAEALKENAEALRINFPGYTSEVRYTDRVLRFPTLFGAGGIVGQAVPAIRVAQSGSCCIPVPPAIPARRSTFP